jgi:hypothetical protein
MAPPADPSCPDSTQPGKTWVTLKAMVSTLYSSPSSAAIDTLCHLTECISLIIESLGPKLHVVVTSWKDCNSSITGYGTTPQ